MRPILFAIVMLAACGQPVLANLDPSDGRPGEDSAGDTSTADTADRPVFEGCGPEGEAA